jgi:MFS transporter, FSR family, fosmidomycin resistance protein
LSAPLIAFSEPNPVLLLAGLLIFQMTMPVTLTAVARLMPHRLATAFGWTCLALILGSLPTMFSWGDVCCGKPLLFAWILLAAVAVWFGLKFVGVRGRLGVVAVRESGAKA